MKTSSLILIVTVAVMFSLCTVCTGRTITVNISGGADFTSIQAAIADAGTVNNDEIQVAPGTYTEAINFLGKAVRLYSSGGANVTTINGTGNYHVVQCVNGEDPNTILDGFTITGGNANGTTYPDYCGGGMYNFVASPTVSRCAFIGNSAYIGGAMYNDSGGSPTVIHCSFYDNSATMHGGGIHNETSNSAIINCYFSGNHSGAHGGGLMNNSSSISTVTNCEFSNNSAGGGGGGVCNSVYCTVNLVNCSFTENTAAYGGGMYSYHSYVTAANCIFWADTTNEIVGDGGSIAVTYSDIQGGYSGTGNIDADPLFLSPAGGDFHLASSGSPCVDAGDSSVITETTDLAGNPRIMDGNADGTAIVDMGVYELQAKSVHNITRDTWYERIQTAINDSDNGDEIEVGPDTYYEAINFLGKAVRLYSSGGAEVTTIDGTGHHHVVQCISGEGAGTILEGFTITGGNANGITSPNYFGGGMYNGGSNPTVIHCTFTGNSADMGGGMYNNTNSNPTVSDCTFRNNTAVHGGGMGNSANSPTVVNCTFSSNSASSYGGGMNNSNSSPTVTRCTFTENSTYSGGGIHNGSSNPTVTHCTFSGNAVSTGGGISNYQSSPTVTYCIFSSNSATVYGGGLYNDYQCSPTVINCIFTNNSANSGGGGMCSYRSTPTITNCTFSRNSAAVNGGGIYNYVQNNSVVTNCILWNDAPGEIYNDTSSPVITYSDVQNGYAGTGNINADPCFANIEGSNPNLWDFRLRPDSPCIDAGNTSALPFGIFGDLAGKSRAWDDPQTPDTGIKVSGLTVDMGVYEFDPCYIAGDINCDGAVDMKDLTILSFNWLKGTEP